MPDLIYTIALDDPDNKARPHRRMAQLLVSSLLRTGWRSDILVIRNAESALFGFPVEGLTEFGVEMPRQNDDHFRSAMRWKMKARDLIHLTREDKVVYLDCDCLALQDPTSLTEGDWDVAYLPETGRSIQQPFFNSYMSEAELANGTAPAINAGTFAVRGDCFHPLMERWEQILDGPPPRPLWRRGSDQAGWNRAVADVIGDSWRGTSNQSLRARPFPKEAIRLPYIEPLSGSDYSRATILHYAGPPVLPRVERMTELYLQLSHAIDRNALFGLQSSNA